MASNSDHGPVHIGIEPGPVHTTIAVSDELPWWSGTPARAPHMDLAEPREMLHTALASEFTPTRGHLVVAVPDRWSVVSQDAALVDPADTEPGERVRATWRASGEFARVDLATVSQCLTAACAGPDGPVLVVDVGDHTIDATLCDHSGAAIRVVDSVSCAVDALDPVTRLLAGTRASTTRVADPHTALRTERRRSAARVELVLAAALRNPDFLHMPVHPAGDHGAAVTASDLSEALRPLATRTADLVRELLSRGIGPVHRCVVGGANALAPVTAAVATAAEIDQSAVRAAGPDAVAIGARRIARGEFEIAGHYPHQVGIRADLVRHGLLESVLLPVTKAGAQLELSVEFAATPQIWLRHNGTGPWRGCRTASDTELPSGRYLVSALTRHTGYGALRFSAVDGGRAVVDIPIEPTA